MPLYFNYNDAEGCKLAVWELTETSCELEAMLSSDELSGIEQCVSEKRKREFLGARVALKQLVRSDVRVLYSDNGRPYLFDNKYFISISHSGNWVAVALNQACEVGIDIEMPSEKIRKVSSRFLNSDELKTFDDDVRLMLCWSAKEAMYKIIGRGAVDFSQQLHVMPFEVANEGVFEAHHPASGMHFRLYYRLFDDFALVYTSRPA